ncbi:hypothetical protein ACQCQ5_18350 [Ralstonia pseudosolanacearum]
MTENNNESLDCVSEAQQLLRQQINAGQESNPEIPCDRERACGVKVNGTG